MDLKGNSIDFLLTAHPHDFSIGSLLSPIFIKGPLNDIEVGIQKDQLIARSSIAVALGILINPAMALLPLIEPGLDKEGPMPPRD